MTGDGDRGRVLAIDSGEARHGLALSDALGLTAQPLPPLRCVGPRKDLDALARLVRDHDVRTIVVGLPLTMAGGEGPAAQRARELAQRLRERLRDPVRIELWDERLTSVEAERLLIEGGVRRAQRRGRVDTLAAVLILQAYLDAGSAR